MIRAQEEMDQQVLSVQLDPVRMEESYDPVPDVIVSNFISIPSLYRETSLTMRT